LLLAGAMVVAVVGAALALPKLHDETAGQASVSAAVDAQENAPPPAKTRKSTARPKVAPAMKVEELATSAPPASEDPVADPSASEASSVDPSATAEQAASAALSVEPSGAASAPLEPVRPAAPAPAVAQLPTQLPAVTKAPLPARPARPARATAGRSKPAPAAPKERAPSESPAQIASVRSQIETYQLEAGFDPEGARAKLAKLRNGLDQRSPLRREVDAAIKSIRD
jgi:hypothetical protein